MQLINDMLDFSAHPAYATALCTTDYLSTIFNNQVHRFHRAMNPNDFDKLNIRC